MRLQFRMLELFDAMLYSADFPEGFRAAVELRGFKVGPQPPTANRQAEGRLPHAAKRAAVHPGRFRLRRSARRRLPAADRQPRSGPHQPHRGHGARNAAATGCPLNEAVGLLETTGLTRHAGGGRRDGEGRRRPRDPMRAERFLRRLHEDCRQHVGRGHGDRGRTPHGRAMGGRAGGRRDPSVRPAGDGGHRLAARIQSA